MAASLIDRFRGDFDPKRYTDTYTERLLDVIRRKRKGEEVHAAPEVETEEAPDLMEALRASLEANAPKRKAPPRRKASSSGRRPTSSSRRRSTSSRRPRR